MLNYLELAQKLEKTSFKDIYLNKQGKFLIYIETFAKKSAIIRQDLQTGFKEILTSIPEAKTSIGYGGLALACNDERVVFTSSDGFVYSLCLKTYAQKKISPNYQGLTHPCLSPCGSFVAYVAEDSSGCSLNLVDVEGKEKPYVITKARWYIFNPCFSPSHKQIVWQEWKKEHMPWFESQIFSAQFKKAFNKLTIKDLELGQLTTHCLFSKKNTNFSYPSFSPDGKYLSYISDHKTSWRNIHLSDMNGQDIKTFPLLKDTEIGKLEWVSGLRVTQWLSSTKLLTLAYKNSRCHLLELDIEKKLWKDLDIDFDDIDEFFVDQLSQSIVCSGSKANKADEMICFKYPNHSKKLITKSTPTSAHIENYAKPNILSWKSSKGINLNGIFYPAQNSKKKATD